MPGRLVGVGFAVNNNPRLELKYVPFQHVYAEGTDDLSCFMLTYFFPSKKGHDPRLLGGLSYQKFWIEEKVPIF